MPIFMTGPLASEAGAGGGIDLSNTSFGTNTTIGYSMNGDTTGTTLTVSDPLPRASLSLLGQYTASSFGTAGDASGGTSVDDQAASGHPATWTCIDPITGNGGGLRDNS